VAADPVEPAAKKRSDLPVRVASAVVMVAVAGGAFWLGGWVLTSFIVMLGLGVFAEWTKLVLAFERRFALRMVWLLAGLGYVGLACYAALQLAVESVALLVVVAGVIAVDVGAYFAGRTFGGPKIAPAISPSKTWSGLGGAILTVSTLLVCLFWWRYRNELAAIRYLVVHYGPLDEHQVYPSFHWLYAIVVGTLTAIIAQFGDFFESWMKRRAGVKDSGRLIPGHGGLFDRTDGLMAVLFVIGLYSLVDMVR